MTYQVLARKWRPQTFQEVIGQEHITRSLTNSISRGNVGHAYIFTGTRGIGKTTVARIFAKALRCETPMEDSNPCGNCPSCKDFETGNSMNVLEMDGASHNSVDDVRDMIANVQYLPTSGTRRIYIVDEVHMLSPSAFNAFLKTLEEPPAHVIFIFATTEPHKLPATVMSRLQRFDCRNATMPDLVRLMTKIGEKEEIEFESADLINQICKQGNGSFRDTLSLLDQVLSFSLDKKVSEETLVTALGIARISAVREMATGLFSGDVSALSSAYREMIAENVEPQNIVRALLDLLFECAEKIDRTDEIVSAGLLNPGTLDEVSAPEIFWIFETLAKDSKWTLESLDPIKVTEIALQKLALRRSFIAKSEDQSVEQPKKKTVFEPVVEKEIIPE
ncbi:MAG: DNA polymerase III subunit gamma/tau, partial [Halobacteriovoraceae bacterium]|nr:DNA polymerase III subunit gamma/tau [Halobacteriovoraceae bacterium]